MQYVIDNYDYIELLDRMSREQRDKNQSSTPMIRYQNEYYIVEAVLQYKNTWLLLFPRIKIKRESNRRKMYKPLHQTSETLLLIPLLLITVYYKMISLSIERTYKTKKIIRTWQQKYHGKTIQQM